MIRIKNQESRIKLFINIVSAALFFILTALFYSPVYADVKIGDYFGFGDIKSLGEGTSLRKSV